MIKVFNAGGPAFMGIMTLILLFCFILNVISFLMYRRGDQKRSKRISGLLREAGLLAIVVGALGPFIGLYEAFTAIEQLGEVSQAMLMEGLKVSSVTTIYGSIILLISYMMNIGLNLLLADN